MSALHPTFAAAIRRTEDGMKDYSREIRTETWQGVDISKQPAARMKEILSWDFRVPMEDITLDRLREEVKPNLPWADEHFEERICGYPMNPGETWKKWPWGNSAANFRDGKGRFEINYMERYWAGSLPVATNHLRKLETSHFEDTPVEGRTTALSGIRGRPYGDLANVIDLLAKEPYTRQAYLPIFFPEDTGAGGRIPCSLGYYWIMRGNYFHVHYPIRSCDFYRHFRDDIYLTVRLTMWMLEKLASINPKNWAGVKLGFYSMWIGSLHMFINDYHQLFGSGNRR